MIFGSLSLHQVELLLAILSGAAGIAHVLAPDHWVPLSILSWQRRWSVSRVSAFSLLAYTLHVALGAGIYFVIAPFTSGMNSEHLLILAVVLMVGATTMRGFRFDRMREVLGAGPKSVWSLLAAVSLLGPAESLIPILLKSFQLGTGYLLPLGSYLLGTLAGALGAILISRRAWNSPTWIPRGIRWANQKTSAIPFALAAVTGIFLLVTMG